MPVHTFIAKSAADAIAQIRATLGPEAVVLNVRRSPVEGLARLWQKPGIEVLAHVPGKQTPQIPSDMLAELRQELREIRQKVEGRQTDFPFQEPERRSPDRPDSSREPQPADREIGVPMLGRYMVPDARSTLEVEAANGDWRAGALLENIGVLPSYAQSVVEELRAQHGDVAPKSFVKEFDLTHEVLVGRWRQPAAPETDRADTHVFIGPPGAGKTTCLCKWLAQTTLVEGRPAAVWRLDGHVANTAESLNVFCEILGVPLERFQPARVDQASSLTGQAGSLFHSNGVLFIDLPGANSADAAALASLGKQLSQLPNPQVHLVLNAAYETSLSLDQVRAFAALPIADLIVTHLDEELRWGKLWNFVLGTNYTLRFLSAGQNIPGEFAEATPDRILARQFARK